MKGRVLIAAKTKITGNMKSLMKSKSLYLRIREEKGCKRVKGRVFIPGNI